MAEPKKKLRVELWNENGELKLRVFKDATDAAKETGFDVHKIIEACHNGKAYKGFLWRYRA